MTPALRHPHRGTHTVAPTPGWLQGPGWHPRPRAPHVRSPRAHPSRIPCAQPVCARGRRLRGCPTGVELSPQRSQPAERGGARQGGGPPARARPRCASPCAGPGGTQEGWGGRGQPQPRRQRAGGNTAVQDKPGKVRGCPPAPLPRPCRAARPRLGMVWSSRHWGLLGAPVAGLFPSPSGAAPRSPWGPHQCQPPGPGGDSTAADCWGPGGCGGGTVREGAPCCHCHFPRPPQPRSPGPGQDLLWHLRPQEGAPPPHSHAAGASQCQCRCPHPREAGGKPAGSPALPSHPPRSCRLCMGHGGGLAGAGVVPGGAWAQHAGPSEPHGVV